MKHIPHYLSLTATPIPRSLARLLFTGSDVSLLTEKPGNRLPVATKILHENERNVAYTHIRKAVQHDEQVFVICPIIEESDTLGVKAATAVHKDLSQNVFPDLSVGLVHGKLKQKEKDKTMAAFAGHTVSILVATAVVEVGIDIQNASVMLIEGAERFGLAQLHQFRGRIGRNNKPATCYAIQTDSAKKISPRLHAFADTQDGFALAELDLELRGPGALFGTVQSGFLPLKIANIADSVLLARAKKIVSALETSRS
jgi:ATP-dependent DNA helicase RecG